MFELLTPNGLAHAVEVGVIDYQKIIEMINKEEEKENAETSI